MQAIILAAGMGKRLEDLTKNNTKCMVKVNNIPLIDRIIENIQEIDLNKIIIVIGYKGQNLKNHINLHYKNLNIQFIENPIYDKTNNIYSLALCEKEMKSDDSLIIESDLILDSSILKRVVQSRFATLAVVAKYQNWMDGTVITRDKDNNITSFIPKKKFIEKDKGSYWKTVNIYRFSKDFSQKIYLPFLKTFMQVFGFNEYYEQVLSIITWQNKTMIKSLTLNEDEKWYEIDTQKDLENAENIFS